MNPFKVPYKITQPYDSRSDRYKSGWHRAIDMIPLPVGPELMYPFFPSKVVDIAKGMIAVSGKLPSEFVSFFRSKNLIPQNYSGEVHLKINFLHGLDALVKVGDSVDANTPIARCGNIGMVYSNNIPVPPDQQGVRPYPGLHLHLECILHPNDTSHPFNTDKDILGRIDPALLLNYKLMPNQAKIVVSKNSTTVYVCYPIPSEKHLEERASLEGMTVPNPIPNSDTL